MSTCKRRSSHDCSQVPFGRRQKPWRPTSNCPIMKISANTETKQVRNTPEERASPLTAGRKHVTVQCASRTTAHVFIPDSASLSLVFRPRASSCARPRLWRRNETHPTCLRRPLTNPVLVGLSAPRWSVHLTPCLAGENPWSNRETSGILCWVGTRNAGHRVQPEKTPRVQLRKLQAHFAGRVPGMQEVRLRKLEGYFAAPAASSQRKTPWSNSIRHAWSAPCQAQESCLILQGLCVSATRCTAWKNSAVLRRRGPWTAVMT